jgi:ribosomal protein RSM22 (predicted rRNA methylase)
VAERRPAWAPRTLLDLGSGPGTAAWAAAAAFPTLREATLVERAPAMIAAAARLAAGARAPVLRRARWTRDSVLAAWPSGGPPADLVTACYVLGELSDDDVTRAVARWWQAAGAELVIVEPGTPAGFDRIRRARAGLLAAGATITAPCPADGACPRAGDDWCHFGRRVARSALHRSVKGAGLGFEDEKYAYVVASRQAPAHAGARLLRVPQDRAGHLRLALCEAPAGTPEVRQAVVARSQRDDFRWARHARWGDAVPPGTAGTRQANGTAGASCSSA